MGFLDKYEFPNNAIYNLKTKDGGSKCSGIAKIDVKQIEKLDEVEDKIYFEKKYAVANWWS